MFRGYTRCSQWRGISLDNVVTTHKRPFSHRMCSWSPHVFGKPVCASTKATTVLVKNEANKTLRIMPLGGSITYGQGSSDGNGYRRALRDLLISDGYQVTMVGSRKVGTMSNNETEGWRGQRLDQILTKAMRAVPLLQPNVVTLNAGSNDCIENFRTDTFGDRMRAMLEYLWEAAPHPTVLLSTLVVSADQDTQSRIVAANAHLCNIAREMVAERKRLVLVDMGGGAGVGVGVVGPRTTDLVDGTHPNDKGYEAMARLWHRGFQEAAGLGFIHKP